MDNIISESFNINVTHSAPVTPVDPNALSPDTGFAGFTSNAGDVANNLGFSGCALIISVALLLIIGTVLFILRRKFNRTAMSLASVATFALAFGLSFPAIYSVSGALGAATHTTNFNVTTADAPTVFTADITDITLAEDAPAGYTVTAYFDDDTDNTIYNADKTAKIKAITNPVSDPEQFDNYTYGIKDLTNDTYAPVPAGADNAITIASTTTPATAGTPITPLTFAVKLDNTIPEGEYQGKIVYTITLNIALGSFNSAFANAGKEKVTAADGNKYYKMQDMSASICSAVTAPDPNNVQDAQTSTLVDIRDGKTYKVAKLADGKCWMTQNLDLDLDGTTLTSADTNLIDTAEWTPDHNTIPQDQSLTWENVNTSPRSYDRGEEYIVTSNSEGLDTIYTSLEACTNAGHVASECMHYATGNYYNWTAAKATNNSTSQTDYSSSSNDSICPKGWTLPSANSAEPSEFGIMLNAQGVISGDTSTSYTVPDGFNLLRSTPLYLVRAGYISDNGRNYASSNGNYWLADSANSSDAYATSFYSNYTYLRYYYGRSQGRSIRCLAL